MSGGWPRYQHDEERHRVPQALNRPSGDLCTGTGQSCDVCPTSVSVEVASSNWQLVS